MNSRSGSHIRWIPILWRHPEFLHLTIGEMKNRYALVLAFCAVSTLSARADVKSIIQRSVAANQEDWKSSPEYSYFERDRNAEGTKTYRVLMLMGSPYRYLVAVNGMALSPADQNRERQKLDQVTAQRQNESEQQREERIGEYQKGRRRDHLMMEQLVDAFNFTLLGKQKLDGFNAYVLTAKPRPGYQPPNTETKALTGMQGKLWIDTKTFQWVKVMAQVVHPVNVEGFLATIEPGTRFELEKMPVTNGVWLPKHFAMTSRARILFFFTRKQREEETYFDYRMGNSIPTYGAATSGASPVQSGPATGQGSRNANDRKR
jgi:hypothetical protein